MAKIDITHRTGGLYDVIVDDGRGTTRHEVTVWPSDVARYAPDATPEALLEASFVFLLRHVEGLSIDELAELFRFEKNNVSVRLHRIRLRLQAEMER